MKKILAAFLLFCTSLLLAEGMVIKKEEKDLTCGTAPYEHPKWASEIELINGKKIHFSCVKCMMLFYYKNKEWKDLGDFGDKEPVKSLFVQDYETLKIVDAKKAFYVYGSRITGPKGDDLIPFEEKAGAEKFMEKNGGNRILTWADFKLNLFDFLNL